MRLASTSMSEISDSRVRGLCEASRTELDSFSAVGYIIANLSGCTDDDILKALGSQDGFTGEQRIRFIDGLKDALGAIRERKIRDFDSIAKEILAYRRRFLDDASRVLALEGTTI